MKTGYYVVDTRTGFYVAGPYTKMKRAQRQRDIKDLEYGAYRYSVHYEEGRQDATILARV